jgi:hypothetical protein
MYQIYNWAGNRIGNLSFETAEDAWDYILGDLTDKLNLSEEDYQEYYAVANDIRSGLKINVKRCKGHNL